VQTIGPERTDLIVTERETNAILNFVIENRKAPFRTFRMLVDLSVGQKDSREICPHRADSQLS
jgi:hypothetical protein